jgi:signal transduction histidine kinase
VKWLAATAVLGLIVLLAVTYRSLVGHQRQNNVIVHSYRAIGELDGVLSIIKDAETGTRGYLLTNDTSFLVPFDSAAGRTAKHLDVLHELAAQDSASHQGIRRMRHQVDRRLRLLALRVNERHRGVMVNENEQTRLVMEGKLVMDGLRTTHRALLDRQRRILSEEEAEGRALARSAPQWLAVFAGLALACITALLIWAFRSAQRARIAAQLAQRTAAELAVQVRQREEAERSWKRVLDSSPSGIMAFDAIRDKDGEIVDFQCTRMNEAAEEIVRRRSEVMLQHSILEMRPENVRSPLFKEYIYVVETGEPFKTETEYTRDGVTSTLAVSAVRLQDGLVVTFTDITEGKRQAALAQEGERLSVTGRFARLVGHEVRNPLTNIQLALDQLESEGQQLPEQQLYLDILRRNAMRIGQLITEMLHSSRPLEMKLVPGDVNAVLAEAFTRVRDRCDLLGTKITLDLNKTLRKIPMDKETLTIAFTNILVNALEAMEEGKGELTIRSAHVKGLVQVIISDNGRGMSAKDKDRIFQPFFSGRTGGMGLGLTEARNIFNAHGALLSVESEEGKGTSFRLLFPA